MHFCADDPIVTDCVSGDIRLIGGRTTFEGTVEVCIVFGEVCVNIAGLLMKLTRCALLVGIPIKRYVRKRSIGDSSVLSMP